MTDIKHSQDNERHEINWKKNPDSYSSHPHSHHLMNLYPQALINPSTSPNKATMGPDNPDRDESDSLSGYSDDENHKRKQRRYR